MDKEIKTSKRRGRPPALNTAPITLQVRLECGLIGIKELAKLAGVSEGKVRLDAKAGKVKLVKHGFLTKVRGPDAKAYMGYVASDAA